MGVAGEELTRRILLVRSGDVCERCGVARGTSVHHRRKVGRVWCPANCGRTCGTGTTGCHGWIEANPDAARAEGWWVDAHEDPEEVPVRRYAAWPGREVWLRPDGAVTWCAPGERDSAAAS